MSNETLLEVVDVVKEDGPKFQGERSYYPSQIPTDNTERVESSSSSSIQDYSSHSSHRPTECSSGVEVMTIGAPKVEELAANLMVATKENKRYRIAMEECNKVLSREVAMLEKYRVKNTELEDLNKSLQDQLSAKVRVLENR